MTGRWVAGRLVVFGAYSRAYRHIAARLHAILKLRESNRSQTCLANTMIIDSSCQNCSLSTAALNTANMSAKFLT